MDDLRWYFPESVDELRELVAGDGNLVHGGGTGLLMRGLARKGITGAKGLIDLSAIRCLEGYPLDFVTHDDGVHRLGALNTYATTAEAMSAIDKGHILAKALTASVPPAFSYSRKSCAIISLLSGSR